MREEDIKVRQEGRSVDCVLLCRSRNQALHLTAYADDNPPLGYIMLMSKIRRRPRGGRARFVTLCYRHTDNQQHPPMTDWQEWVDTLDVEHQIASSDRPVRLHEVDGT